MVSPCFFVHCGKAWCHKKSVYSVVSCFWFYDFTMIHVSYSSDSEIIHLEFIDPWFSLFSAVCQFMSLLLSLTHCCRGNFSFSSDSEVIHLEFIDPWISLFSAVCQFMSLLLSLTQLPW